MAILKSVVDVNNGNTGWTSGDVLDALETVFANLGFHGGSASSGVPYSISAPNGTVSTRNTAWHAVGRQIYYTWKDVYYELVADGTTAYRPLKRTYMQSWSYVWNDTDATYPSTFRRDGHGFTQGQAIHWAPGETEETRNIGGLTLDTVYYVIVVDGNYFKLAANATDAANGTNIVLTYGGYSSSVYAAKSNTISSFREVNDASKNNATIRIGKQDRLNLSLVDVAGTGNFHLCYDTDDYDAAKHVTNALHPNAAGYGIVDPTGTGADTGTVVFDTFGYLQTHDDVTALPSQHPTETNTASSRKYIYASDTNSSMKGEIIIEAYVTNRGNDGLGNPWWDYTVPQSGGRSALKIRTFRYQDQNSTSYYGKLAGMQIRQIGSGWTQNEVFTIPGEEIGGFETLDDVVFGVRDNASTPAINVKNLGAGSNFYWKVDGSYGILKVVNDAAKTYGTSYYSIGICTDVNNKIAFNSGSGLGWLNYSSPIFNGEAGLDYQNNYNVPLTTTGASYRTYDTVEYCTSATPTAYPLEIRVYRAQAPQDTNFAIIQFCQTINGVVQPYGSFTIYKGATFGSNVWDLDYVYNGSMMTYEVGTRQIQLNHRVVGARYSYYSSNSDVSEPVNNESKAREAFYGYLRDPGNGTDDGILSRYVCNIETDANGNYDLLLYYRNSTYDTIGGNAVAAEADYYKPIKGLPINERMVPCPYYLPDDFVMLQVSTTPGLTQFRTGDTVTIGGTETYEIIRASYQTQQNGLDGVDNNSTIGMLFLARIS